MSTSRTSKWRLPAGVLVALLVWWASTGIWIVEQNEKGVVLTFGSASRVAAAGMHFTLPAPFETMEVVQTTAVRTITVGVATEAELAQDRFDDDNPEWLSGDTNIIDMRLTVQFVVADPVKWLFGVRAGDESSEPGGRALLVRKLTETVVTQLVAGMPIDEAMSSGKGPLQREAQTRVQKLLDELQTGIALVSVNVSEASAPQQVIASFNDVSSAIADAEREQDDADGYRRDQLPKKRAEARTALAAAEGYALETVREAQGRADTFLALVEKYEIAPELTRRQIALETWGEILERCEVIPIDEGESFSIKIVR